MNFKVTVHNVLYCVFDERCCSSALSPGYDYKPEVHVLLAIGGQQHSIAGFCADVAASMKK
jgi:hypothetical protein